MAAILLSHFEFPDGRIIPSEMIDHILGYLRYSPFQYALDKDNRRNKTIVDRKTGKRINNPSRVCSHCSACKYSLDLVYVSKLLISDMIIFVDFCCSSECCLERSDKLRIDFNKGLVIKPISYLHEKEVENLGEKRILLVPGIGRTIGCLDPQWQKLEDSEVADKVMLCTCYQPFNCYFMHQHRKCKSGKST